MSLRRSSVSGGIGTRTTLPSLVGFSPRSEVRMALSISGTAPGSHGAITIDHRLGHRERPELVHRHRRAVIIDANVVEQRDVRAARAHAGKLLAEILDGLFHPRAGLRHRFLAVGNCAHRVRVPAIHSAVTVDPTFSPITTRLMFPGRFILKMTIGMRLSMHSEMAVESITARPF